MGIALPLILVVCLCVAAGMVWRRRGPSTQPTRGPSPPGRAHGGTAPYRAGPAGRATIVIASGRHPVDRPLLELVLNFGARSLHSEPAPRADLVLFLR